MKNLVLIILCLCMGCSSDDDQNAPVFKTEEQCLESHYYYYEDEKRYFQDRLLYNKAVLSFALTVPNAAIIQFINGDSEIQDITAENIRQDGSNYKLVIVTFNSNKTCIEIATYLQDIKSNELVYFANYAYLSTFWFGGEYYDVMYYGDIFYVKVLNADDLTTLSQLVEQTNTEIVGTLQYMPDWIKIKVSKYSDGDAKEMANYFYESNVANIEITEIGFGHLIDN